MTPSQAAYGVGFEAAVVECPVVALLEERTDDVGHLGVVDILVIEGVEILEVGIREVYRVGVVLRVVESRYSHHDRCPRSHGIIGARAGDHERAVYREILVHHVGVVVVLVGGQECRLHYHQPVGIERTVGVVRDLDVLVAVVLHTLGRERAGEEYLLDDEIVGGDRRHRGLDRETVF